MFEATASLTPLCTCTARQAEEIPLTLLTILDPSHHRFDTIVVGFLWLDVIAVMQFIRQLPRTSLVSLSHLNILA